MIEWPQIAGRSFISQKILPIVFSVEHEKSLASGLFRNYAAFTPIDHVKTIAPSVVTM